MTRSGPGCPEKTPLLLSVLSLPGYCCITSYCSSPLTPVSPRLLLRCQTNDTDFPTGAERAANITPHTSTQSHTKHTQSHKHSTHNPTRNTQNHTINAHTQHKQSHILRHNTYNHIHDTHNHKHNTHNQHTKSTLTITHTITHTIATMMHILPQTKYDRLGINMKRRRETESMIVYIWESDSKYNQSRTIII